MSAERSTTIDIDNELGSAKRLLNQGQFAASSAKLLGILEHFPEDQEAQYVLAVCYRYARKTRDASATLDQLLRLNPKYAWGYQERGHLYRVNKPAEAILAYEHAVSLNPALLATWKNLSALYKSEGQSDRSQSCDRQVESLSRLPPELLSVTSMIHEGKLYKAEQLCRAFMQKNPRHVDGMRLLARLGSELNILDDAEFLLESCLEFAPDFRAARYDYAQVLYKRQRFSKSLEQAERLLQDEPDNPDFQLICANAAAAVGDFDKAMVFYDRLIELHADKVQLRLLKGHALKSLGEPQRAIETYRAAVGIRPDYGDAYWSLANIKTYLFEESEISAMRNAEADAATENIDRYQLCFALGKNFEDNNNHAAAFEYYARGNQLKLAETGYLAERVENEFARQQEVCTQQFFDDRTGYGADSNEPIFIVGLPRAGSTLLEQILASHPMVDGTSELPNIMSLAQKLGGRHQTDEEPRYPAILETLDLQQCERFGNEFLESTRVYRQGAPFFTDKMPNNFRHIGLIQLIFPNAKIIDARRHPMACCFSNFKQLYGEGHEFSYGLKELGRYYSAYVELMDHWENVLPGKILRVQYEDVVADLEAQVRRLLDFLGLPFDQHCIEFHKTERAVHTPSAEQVRQPLYKSSVEQWKNFEPFLDPLKEIGGIV